MVDIRLAEIMGRKKMKQAELANKAGVRPNTISDLWHGRSKRVDLETLEAICLVLGCSIGELLVIVADEKSPDTK